MNERIRLLAEQAGCKIINEGIYRQRNVTYG